MLVPRSGIGPNTDVDIVINHINIICNSSLFFGEERLIHSHFEPDAQSCVVSPENLTIPTLVPRSGIRLVALCRFYALSSLRISSQYQSYFFTSVCPRYGLLPKVVGVFTDCET